MELIVDMIAAGILVSLAWNALVLVCIPAALEGVKELYKLLFRRPMTCALLWFSGRVLYLALTH